MGTCQIAHCQCQCKINKISCQCGSQLSELSVLSSENQIQQNVNSNQNQNNQSPNQPSIDQNYSSQQSFSRQNRFSQSSQRKSPGNSKDSTETVKQSKTTQAYKSTRQLDYNKDYLASHECNITIEQEESSKNTSQIASMIMNPRNQYFPSESNSNGSQGINFDTFAQQPKNSEDSNSQKLKKQPSPKFESNSFSQKSSVQSEFDKKMKEFEQQKQKFDKSLKKNQQFKPVKYAQSLSISQDDNRNSSNEVKKNTNSIKSIQPQIFQGSNEHLKDSDYDKYKSLNQADISVSSNRSNTPSKGVLKQRSHPQKSNDSRSSFKQVKFNLPQSFYIKEKMSHQQKYFK